jgi:hypothetical protein
MKTYFRLLIFVLAIFFLASAGLDSNRSTVKADGNNPCDPTFFLLKLCQLRGGTFNSSTCQCDLP